MINRDETHQPCDQIIDIAQWDVFEDYEIYPEGARNKTLRVCPKHSATDFCIAGHNYLFKESMKSTKNPEQKRHPEQYWSEIIAFHIGRLMGLEVPPAFVAINSETGEPGSIIEWFTGYDDNIRERTTSGGKHMKQVVGDEYDLQKGEQHNINSVITFSRRLSISGTLQHDWRSYWAQCLCFDAIIGNTDRHHENWQVIWDESGEKARFSPLFDNGTSLGHELFKKKLKKYISDTKALETYIKKGHHHMRWHKNDDSRMPLIEGFVRYCRKYPTVVDDLLSRLQWNDSEVETLLSALMKFEIAYPMTQLRAEFIHVLVCKKKQILKEQLEGIRDAIH